jgi:hypothetical protein
MSETWNSILTGAIGGLIVLGIQEIIAVYRGKRKNKSEKTVKSWSTDKIITTSVIFDLSPGANIELMRELLGIPLKYKKSDWPIFREIEVQTNSYLYSFQNAYLKITSKDNISIDSITVVAFDSSIELDSITFLSDENDYRLNKAKVNQEILSHITAHDFIHTRMDASFALQHYIPNPVYKSYTYFGGCLEKGFEYHEHKDPNIFLDEKITGVCISESSEDIYFIYDMELR